MFFIRGESVFRERLTVTFCSTWKCICKNRQTAGMRLISVETQGAPRAPRGRGFCVLHLVAAAHTVS